MWFPSWGLGTRFSHLSLEISFPSSSLGMQGTFGKSNFRSRSFDDKWVPKLELGNQNWCRILGTRIDAGASEPGFNPGKPLVRSAVIRPIRIDPRSIAYGLVPEMPHPGEDHGDAVLVRCGDNLGVAHAAAR